MLIFSAVSFFSLQYWLIGWLFRRLICMNWFVGVVREPQLRDHMCEFHRMCSNFCVVSLRRILAEHVLRQLRQTRLDKKKQPCVSYRRVSGDDSTKKP